MNEQENKSGLPFAKLIPLGRRRRVQYRLYPVIKANGYFSNDSVRRIDFTYRKYWLGLYGLVSEDTVDVFCKPNLYWRHGHPDGPFTNNRLDAELGQLWFKHEYEHATTQMAFDILSGKQIP